MSVVAVPERHRAAVAAFLEMGDDARRELLAKMLTVDLVCDLLDGEAVEPVQLRVAYQLLAAELVLYELRADLGADQL